MRLVVVPWNVGGLLGTSILRHHFVTNKVGSSIVVGEQTAVEREAVEEQSQRVFSFEKVF